MGGGKKKKAAKKPTKKKRKAKAKKVSARAARMRLFSGKGTKSKGGLSKAAFTKNKSGRIVSKKRSARGGKSKWIAAVMSARKQLKLKGFVACKKGTAYYKLARKHYASKQVPVEIAANYS